MKLLVFLIVVAVLFFVATQIKVINFESMTPNEKKVLSDRNKIRTMLSSNYVKADDTISEKKVESFGNTKNKVKSNFRRGYPAPDKPSLTKIVDSINADLVKNMDFNQANRPVQNRNPNTNPKETDGLIQEKIMKELSNWNSTYFSDNFDLDQIRMIKATECEDQTLLMVICSAIHNGKPFYLKLIYNCQWVFSDEILNSIGPEMEMNLVKIQPINKSQYDQLYSKSKVEEKPFMTMDEQLDYVAHIKKLHQEEMA